VKTRGAAVLVVAVAGLAGCAGAPEGVDGDLVGGWAPMPELELMVPEAGVCHSGDFRETVRLGLYYDPVDCAAFPSAQETVHVGRFEGEAAERDTPPNPGTGHWRAAYRECDEAAEDYLGADFRHGFLWLGVGVPTNPAWQAGARWFRCDVVEHNEDDRVAVLEGSRRGALAGPSELARGCFTYTDDEWLVPAECTEPHQAEFVGVWHWEESRLPRSDASWERLHRGCRELVAEYVGLPVDGDLSRRTGTFVDPISEEDWDNGDRGFRCYLWLEDAEFTESLKDAGPDALPVG
jgi:hypothetical protein